MAAGMIEQKLKLIITNTPDSTLLILFSLFVLALAAVVVAIVILLVKRSKSSSSHLRGQGAGSRAMLMDDVVEYGRSNDGNDDGGMEEGGGSSWVTIRKVLMSSMRWSEGSRLAEEEVMMMSSTSVSSCSSSSRSHSRSCNNWAEVKEISSSTDGVLLTPSTSTTATTVTPLRIQTLRSTINCLEEKMSVATVPKEPSSPVLVPPRQVVERGRGLQYGWRRGNLRRDRQTTEPVWQRPILMGEKCELPKFSGVILYDERGRPLHRQYEHHCSLTSSDHCRHDLDQSQKEGTATKRTTLKDLM